MLSLFPISISLRYNILKNNFIAIYYFILKGNNFLMILPNSHEERINRVTELKSGLLVTTSSDQNAIIMKLNYDKKD